MQEKTHTYVHAHAHTILVTIFEVNLGYLVATFSQCICL